MSANSVQPDQLAVTYEKAAELLSVSPRTVWSLVASNELRAVRIGRRCVRIPKAEIERFLAEHTGASRRQVA
jgi:excisionase family DNA binding protein